MTLKPFNTLPSKSLGCLLLTMALTACGGGGGGGSSAPPPSNTQSSSSTAQVSSTSSEAQSSVDQSSESSSVTESSSSVMVSSSSANNSSSENTSSSAVSSTNGQTSSASSETVASESSSSIGSSSSSTRSDQSSSSESSDSESSSSVSTSSSSNSSQSSSSESSASEASSSVSSSSSSEAAVAPSVDAGAAQSVVIGENVSFGASASADAGNNIVSYLWEQVDDTGVVTSIVNDGQLEASFTAPNVVSPTALVFKLTVKDDQDLSSSDTVTVTVNPDPNAPSLQVAFPPPGGIYIAEDNSNTLSIFGEVTTQGGAAVNAITIKGITPEVTATVNGQQWRADDLAIPTGLSEITLTVEAEDDQGRISQENVQLSISDDYVYTYGTRARAILWDESIDKLWVLGADLFIDETEIVPVDPVTGARGTSILSTPMAATRMIFNADQSGFLVSGAIANEPGKIHSVEKSTGTVSVLSSESTGSGPDLQTGSAGLAVDGNDLYVAENSSSGFSGLMRVNLLNGDREILLEAVDSDSLTYALSDIAYLDNEVIMVKNSFSNSPVLGYNLNTLTDRQVNSTGSQITSRGRLTVAGEDIIGVSNTTSLVRINVSSGSVSRVSGNLPLTGGNNIKYVTYDSDSKLFYAITMRNAIVVVDEESGHVVGLAGD